jgi:multidrug resistance efflux pump
MDGNLAMKSPAAEKAAQPKANLRERVQSLRLPDDELSSTSGRRWLWLLLVCIAAGGGYVAYKSLAVREDQPTPIAVSPSAGSTSKAANSNTATVATTGSTAQPPKAAQTSDSAAVASSGEIAHESKGYIIAAHQILVSPKVPGMLTMLKIEEGQRVKKDDVLAQLETTDYDADYQRAEASVAIAQQRLLELENGNRKEEIAQAQAELQEAQAQRTQLYAEWQRITQLRKSGVATQSEYDLAEANFKANDRRVERLQKGYDLMIEGPRKERIDAARGDLALAKAELAKSKWRLDNCTIKAPISGTILIKRAEEGNIVNPIVMNGSYSLCEMADLSDLEVELKIQERDVSKIFKGQKCQVRAEAWPDRVYQGYVSRLMPIADRGQGAVPVRVKISVPPAEEGVYLKPEMGAVVTFFKGS